MGETEPVLRRAWALSAGNFWRLTGVLVALFLPLLLFFVVLEAGLGQKGARRRHGADADDGRPGAGPPDSAPDLRAGFFFSPLVIGLFAGASVSVWRALKDEQPALDIAV